MNKYQKNIKIRNLHFLNINISIMPITGCHCIIDNNKKFPKNAFMTPLGYDFKKSLEKRIDKIKNET